MRREGTEKVLRFSQYQVRVPAVTLPPQPTQSLTALIPLIG
jgi:hypothetical protein